MEILQTIWTALTNENTIALGIVSIPMTFIEALLIFKLFTTIFNISYTKRQAILYVVLFSVTALIMPYLIPAPFYTFLNILVLPLLAYIILKTDFLKAIMIEIFVYALFFTIATPLIALYTAITGVTSAQIMAIPIQKLVYSLILYIILYCVYRIFKRFNVHITFLDKFKTFSYNVLLINFIIGTVAIAMQAYIECFYIDYLPNSLVITSIIVVIIYFCISLYSLYRTSKLEQTKQLLEEQKIYNKNLNTLYDNIRGFKHDFNNIVQAIGGYISTNNIEGLQRYYRDLLDECQINNNLAVLNPELINNSAIYSLLSDKYCKASEKGIKLNLEVMADLSNLNVKIYELTRILGILLDNALEAASQCDKKVVNVSFRNDKKHNKLLMIIQNTYINKDINIDKIFEKGYSSKHTQDSEHNHGLGLWEVRKYLKKNTNLDLYTTKNDQFFTQQFEIYN